MNSEGGVTEKSESTQTISSAKQSRVWAYFKRIYGDQGLKAKCLVGDCAKVLSTPLHSTSTLIRHLRDVHEVDEFKPKEKLVHRSTHKRIPVKLKKKLDRAVVTAIIEDGRSFGDFLKSGFRKFIQLVLPGYKAPHRNSINTRLKCLHTKHFFITYGFYGYFDPYGISVMTNNEINKTENEIKYIIPQQTSNGPTQASSTTSSNTNGSLTTEKEKKKSLINYFLDSLADEDTQQVKKQSSTLNKILNDEFKT
ncbi:unnamed protein product [Rotaria sordida]|uniref:BED-type domain-containing protein n=1 Tax=Rotaria sordida TaxID=392033 RepID=A0A816DJ11_9BILA|nr:unnamed protein product [Rotaria sordida]CAF1637079.1 unnamed protein product [Rotaria sordida]